MAVRFKQRLLATSVALAAAGILTCVACLLEVFMPHGSLAAFLASLVTAGIAVGAIMACFVWGCEKLERRKDTGQRRTARDAASWLRSVTSVRGGHRALLFERPAQPTKLPTSRQLAEYPLSLRAAVPPRSRLKLRWSHGQ
jgi:hypothetical protein